MAKRIPYPTAQILVYIKEQPKCSSHEILTGLSLDISIATLKRILQNLTAQGLIVALGENKNRRYEISKIYEITRPIDVEEYFEKEIDERVIQHSFNHHLISDTLQEVSLFTKEEMDFLTDLQEMFTNNVSQLSREEYAIEMERLAIDLSWKSSQIEGNTYSLLETERLLKDKETAAGKTRDEATMLLNHKSALDFIVSQSCYISPLSISDIEDIHSILVKDLNISRNIRNRRVGISGTNYRPLDNEFQIREALGDTCTLINSKDSVFEKTLLALVLISYIHPFSDGNKRTARIISNAILINHYFCPVSFRTIDSLEYKKAMLVFYEQNNIGPLKKIFIDQFEFAVKTYF